MCTMIVQKAALQGFGKGASGWFDVNEANVSWDHPFHATQEHALNIDFVNEEHGPSARVAVELSVEGARQSGRDDSGCAGRGRSEGFGVNGAGSEGYGTFKRKAGVLCPRSVQSR